MKNNMEYYQLDFFSDNIDGNNNNNNKSNDSNIDKINNKKSKRKKVSINKDKNIAQDSNKIISHDDNVGKNSKKNINAKTIKKRSTSKKEKINFTEDDMDKLCELYDWYLLVKDSISTIEKNIRNKSDIKIDNDIIQTKKRVNIAVDESIWSDFDRLCANTGINKSNLITQILKEYIHKHKDLI